MSDCPLTRRQRQVLLPMMRGLTCQQSALHLGIAQSTARNHLSKAYKRLGVASLGQASVVMLRTGWALPDDLLPNHAGRPYTTSTRRQMKADRWLPSPAQRLYLDAIDKWLETRDERASGRAGGYRHVMYFEREIMRLAREANDFDGMVAKLAPMICTSEQLAVLQRVRAMPLAA